MMGLQVEIQVSWSTVDRFSLEDDRRFGAAGIQDPHPPDVSGHREEQGSQHMGWDSTVRPAQGTGRHGQGAGESLEKTWKVSVMLARA